MKLVYLNVLIFGVLLGLALSQLEGESQIYKATVTSLFDSSKFTAELVSEDRLSVTLYAVVSPDRSSDAGAAAREYLKTMIFKKSINLEIESEDSENKVKAFAYLENGHNINENLLRNGWAFFDFYNTYENRQKYIALEEAAKKEKLGIWSFKSLPIPEILQPAKIIKKFVGTVVTVFDGDTLTVQRANGKRESVRFHGIDAPERDQASGIQARDYVRNQVLNKRVNVDVTDIDRFGRNVGLIKLSDGVLLNEQIIKNGWGWHYKEYSKFPEWQELENDARKNKLGLWGLPDAPLPPWEYRNGGSKTLPGPSQPKRKSGLLATDPDIEVFDGEILSVSDGDTFVIQHKSSSRRLRMYGIDAPEKNQLGGDLAKEFAESLLLGKVVTAHIKSRDKYDRSIALIVLPNGDIYSEAALKKGFAWHYKSFSDDVSYGKFEQQARDKKLGIWALEGVHIAPWDWRNGVSSYSGV